LDVGLLSAPHLGQRLGSGLPHSAQNFLAPVLSVPHFEQRIALSLPQDFTPSRGAARRCKRRLQEAM
jgi:hypothetical protein